MIIMEEKQHISLEVEELRKTFKSGRTRSLLWRKTQLQALLKMVTDQENKCFQALHQDLAKNKLEAFKDEIGPVKKAINYALDCLKDWTAPKKVGLRLLFYPAKGEIIPEPYGMVLILTSWNYPIDLALEPLVGAIAAGNVAMIKPSEVATATSSFLAETLPLYLDSSAIKVIEGGHETSQQLLQHKWDKIFYTGSSRVASIIMAEAAKHLTPVSLELGGKTPLILDFPSISSNLKLKNIKESIELINSRPKPLAIYAFTNDQTLKKRIVSETSSGSVIFNDVLVHYVCDELPFGGVGESGMGRYHGKYSFDTFSHEKAVLQRGFFLELEARYPPWNGFKMAFCRLAYRFDYFGIVLLFLGLSTYPKDL